MIVDRKQISLWLPKSLLEQVEIYCKTSKVTRTGLIQKCLEMFFEGNLTDHDNDQDKNNLLMMKLEKIEAKIEKLSKSSSLSDQPAKLRTRSPETRETEAKKPVREKPVKRFLVDKSKDLPPRLEEYLQSSNFTRAQANSIEETLRAIVNFGGKATAKQIASFRKLGRPESVRRQIERLEKDEIIFRDRSTVPHTFVLSKHYST